ncbi:uncharacterized protein LOC118117935 isoform X1 [Hippoglossus stenolepis]|uniref:uncharacterized protein LOC118117935 isoform X1 n=1 Tax=Hippoglossus stenolepis TaxID=195615 RepID=UPI001FB01EEC|nr:uncharacterized protein LOC118117935 isoform X1 [Hippoglossus stenolepis]
MDQLHVFIILLVGAVASSQAHINGSVLNLTVSHGGNATLYCDCKSSSGVYIVWYRNCSHVNQPTLVMKTRYQAELLPLNHKYKDNLHPFPRFHLVKNESSESYDLLITNISDSDEGLYYCGTEQVNTKDGKEKDNYIRKSYGNVTRMILTFESQQRETAQSCGPCWMLLFSLCPAFAVLSSLLSSCLVYHFCKRTAKEPEVHEEGSSSSDRMRGNQDGDVCYAALEIRQTTQRPKRKKTQSSDFSTYSDIKTCRL